MAVLFTIFANLHQFVSKYVLTDQSSVSLSVGIFSMPIVYFIILGGIALIAYFCWQSYRQDVQEEKLQKDAVKNDESHSSYNLAWINKLVNWVYMTSPPGLPEAMQRWMEDVNLHLAESEHPIKILVCDVREKSMPPWIGNIGQAQTKENHIELPLFLHFEKDDLALTVSVQEESEGKVIASTYNVVATHFQCWFTLYLSLVDGKGFLAKLAAQPQSANQVKFRLDLLSDQKISTTVPEVVIDIIRKGLLETPIYLNVSNWGPVIPVSKRKRSVRNVKREKSSSPPSNNPSQNDEKSESVRKRNKDKKNRKLVEEDNSIRKSNTMPTGTTNVLSDRLQMEDTQALSGSLGSLVGIKRTQSGRGPAKPIRSREKRVIMKVIETSGLTQDGSIFCRGILDRPQQKCQTQPIKPGSIPAWPNDELTFDLSSRSSEVKLVFYRADDTRASEGSAVASTILYLDQIDTDKSSKLVLKLRTANKENARVKLLLDFTENPVDPTSQKFSSPRRSLDLSYMSEQVQQQEKATSSLSTPSSYSAENMSFMNKAETPVTIVKTITTKKLTKNTTITSPSNAKRAAVESDTATVEGTVVETAMKDLSHQSELAKRSPDANMKLRKGKVIITAIAKTNLDENLSEDVVMVTENIVEEAVQRLGSFHSVADSETRSRAASDVIDEGSVDGTNNGIQERNNGHEKGDQLKSGGKTRRGRSQRPKSLATGVKASDLPQKQTDGSEWPKVRRSRSLIFGRGKKKLYKTGSATDLDKQINSKQESGLGDDSMLAVPENDLQKQKKKKSKSISKIFSKLGRKPSQRKSKLQSDPVDEDNISDSFQSPASSCSASPYQATPASAGRPASYAGSGDSTPSNQPSLTDSSFQNSPSLDGSGLKRSKSLRKRLFGGKRKTNKN